MCRAFFILLLSVIPLSLTAQEVIQINVPSVDTAAKRQNLFSIEYVPLETTPDCLIDYWPCFYLTDDYIIVSCVAKKAFLFDRKSGRFIHEIGKRGQGPGEYYGMWSINGFSEKEQLLYVWEFVYWKGYDIKTGKLKQVLKMPGKKYTIQNPYLYKPGVYLGYTNNTTGKTPYKMVAFDKNGVVSKIYPNYEEIELDTKKNGTPIYAGLFYEYGSNTYLHAPGTDSLFRVMETGLMPYACFKHPKEMSIEVLGETKRYIIFKSFVKMQCHIAFYDKMNKKCYMDPGLENPAEQYLYSKSTQFGVNKNRELTATLNPEDILQYLEKYPASRQKLDQRLLNLQEDDNPVVMILNIKK